jgi:hypothetical protein
MERHVWDRNEKGVCHLIVLSFHTSAHSSPEAIITCRNWLDLLIHTEMIIIKERNAYTSLLVWDCNI